MTDEFRPQILPPEQSAGAMQALLRMSQLLGAGPRSGEIFDSMLQIVLGVAGAEHGCLLVEQDGRWSVAATHGLSDAIARPGNTLSEAAPWLAAVAQQVADTSEVVQHTRDSPDAEDAGPEALLCLPLLHHSMLAGIICLGSSYAGSAWPALPIEVLRLLATQAAVELAGIRLETQNQALAQQIERSAADAARAVREAQAAQALAEEAGHNKSRFLASMSHELRTPINAIINFAGFLDRYGELSERQLLLQRRILANADQLLALFNDAVDLSKLEAGRMDLQCEPADLRPIVESAMATASTLARETAIDLESDFAPDLPAVWIDTRRVRQILSTY